MTSERKYVFSVTKEEVNFILYALNHQMEHKKDYVGWLETRYPESFIEQNEIWKRDEKVVARLNKEFIEQQELFKKKQEEK